MSNNLNNYNLGYKNTLVDIIHTVPIDDIIPHDTYVGALDTCSCGPVIERYDNGNMQIIHNAWDGRE